MLLVTFGRSQFVVHAFLVLLEIALLSVAYDLWTFCLSVLVCVCLSDKITTRNLKLYKKMAIILLTAVVIFFFQILVGSVALETLNREDALSLYCC